MSARMKIMLVESDQNKSRELAAGLKPYGEIVSASDAVGALAIARREKPDAMLIGAHLSGGGALALLRRIRCNVHTTHIPVVALTDKPVSLSGELIAAGAQQCLPRDAGVEEIRGALQSHRLQDLDFTAAIQPELAAPPRLAALAATGLMDTPREEIFDELAALVSGLLHAPTALMSLVADGRQFFKSQTGLAEPWAGARQTRLSHSFCQWVVAGKEPLFIDDARAHPVLGKNLAVRDMGVIAYAGAPLSAPGGAALGSLCAIDSRPRNWTAEELETLQDLAAVTRAYITLREAALSTEGALAATGEAARGLTRVLQRHAGALEAGTRALLIKAIGRQAGELTRRVVIA